MAVSYKTLESVGLLEIFPELRTLTDDFWGQELRGKMFALHPVPLAMDEFEQSDEMKQIQKIADLYRHLSFPVATALICLRPRPWVDSRPESKAALDDVAKLFATLKLPRGLSKGNWLRKGAVVTTISTSCLEFPDVRQWIELLQAICERAHQSVVKHNQPKKRNR
jgi:hypothetical protein